MRTARSCALALALSGLAALVGAGPAAAFDGQVKGEVTDGSAVPIEGITVCAEPVTPLVHTGCSAPTDAQGKYTISGLQGAEYLVHFFVEGHPTLDFAQQWYPEQSSPEAATKVTVPESGVAEPIDARLASGDQIAGVVTDASDHEPIEGVEVCATRLGPFHAGEVGYCRRTGGAGEYRVDDLGTGEYAVRFEAADAGANYVAQDHPGPVSFASPGEEVTGIDAALEPGLAIEGQVTDAATGLPPEATNFTSVPVCAYDPATQAAVGCTSVDLSTGGYSILGLPGGEYVVGFSVDTIEEGLDLHPDGYLRRYWNEVPGFAEATHLGAGEPPGTVIPGIDAKLSRGEEGSGLCGITSPCTSSGAGTTATQSSPLQSTTTPTGLHCRKGFHRVTKDGQARCAKVHKKHKKHKRYRRHRRARRRAR